MKTKRTNPLGEPLFEWTNQRTKAVLLLAKGQFIREVAHEVGVHERTIKRWKTDTNFINELDRLSMMIDFAGRAKRLRIANSMGRLLLKKKYPTNKDLLDWLKYFKSETDGIELGLTDKLIKATTRMASTK